MADSEPGRLWQYAGMGFEFAVSLLVMGFMGWLIDRGAGTSPWGMLVGAVLGFMGSMYLFIRRARAAMREWQPPRPPGSNRS